MLDAMMKKLGVDPAAAVEQIQFIADFMQATAANTENIAARLERLDRQMSAVLELLTHGTAAPAHAVNVKKEFPQ